MNFNQTYPTIQDVIDDIHETIANICNTRAERIVLINRMERYEDSGMDKVELYQAMQKEFDAHTKMEEAYEKGDITHT